MEQPNQDEIKTLEEKKAFKYLGILEADTIKQVMKEKIKVECLRRTRKLLEKKYVAKTLSNESILRLYPSFDNQDPF